MDKPETPIENLRGLLHKESAETRPKKTGEFVPQYVDLPMKPKPAGVRNLQLGLLFLGLALVLLVIANLLTGSRALLPLAACLLAFTLLWVLARLHVFHQRNGVFLAVGMTCLLGAVLAFFERGYVAAERFARVTAASSETPATVVPVPPAPEPELPLLTRELGGKTAESPTGRRVRMLKDARVVVDGKPYLLKAGEVLPLDEVKGGETIVLVNDLRISLASDGVQILGEAPAEKVAAPPALLETPAQITKRAQEEAVRRYPALGDKDSQENAIYVETYRELKNSGSDFLKDPEWPLHLADSIAKKEHWERKGE